MNKGLEPNYQLRDLRLQELDTRWDPARMAVETAVFPWKGPGEVRLSQFDLLCLSPSTLGTIRQLASAEMNRLKSEESLCLPQHQQIGGFYAYQRFYRLAGDLLTIDDARPWVALGSAAVNAREYFLSLGLPKRYNPRQASAWVAQALAAEGMSNEQICIHGWMRSDLLDELLQMELS